LHPKRAFHQDEFFMGKGGIIDENDTILDVDGYFNVDHELE
jgi:hypothetical protein